MRPVDLVSLQPVIITYTQTGGTITVCTVGNTSTTLASFDMGNGALGGGTK